MSAFLVIERPDHGPRVVAAFSTRRDAEEAREILVADEPQLATFVSVRAPERSRSDDQRTARTFVGGWLVALVVVDAMLAYGLYLAVRALLDLV
jgi:hypothetical protein